MRLKKRELVRWKLEMVFTEFIRGGACGWCGSSQVPVWCEVVLSIIILRVTCATEFTPCPPKHSLKKFDGLKTIGFIK